jgi:hypothetical protein
MSLLASIILLTFALLPIPASAWNIPGHMLSAAIAYQVLRQENPTTIEKVKAVLEKHSWYTNQWQVRLQDAPAADHGPVLFMQPARWPDELRITDRQYHRGAVALHQLALQTRRTTGYRANPRTGVGEHPYGVGREREHGEEQ